jgi:hypothetical protein
MLRGAGSLTRMLRHGSMCYSSKHSCLPHLLLNAVVLIAVLPAGSSSDESRPAQAQARRPAVQKPARTLPEIPVQPASRTLHLAESNQWVEIDVHQSRVYDLRWRRLSQPPDAQFNKIPSLLPVLAGIMKTRTRRSFHPDRGVARGSTASTYRFCTARFVCSF